MSLRRGDLVTVAAKGPYTGKPRPALVIQASETLPEPAPGNGVKTISDVMADKVVTVPRSVISPRKLGSLEPEDLRRVDQALRFWPGL
jgi:mRNA interferase MazF